MNEHLTEHAPATAAVALLPHYPEPDSHAQEKQRQIEEDRFFETIPFRSPHRDKDTCQVDPFEKRILIKFARERDDIDWDRYQEWHGYICRLYPDWHSGFVHVWLINRPFLWVKGQHEMMTQAEFEATHDAFVSLPDSVPLEEEVNWVKSHRRLFELRQLYDGKTPPDVDTSLTSDEVLRPANGPAPSKGAVTMLQEAMRDPKNFWKLVFSKRASTPVRPVGRPPKEKPPEPEDSAGDVDDVWGEGDEDADIFA